MNLHLEGKRALITGSTAGIGFAIAKNLHSEGVDVILNGKEQDVLDDAIKEIGRKTNGARVSGIVADLEKLDSTNKLADQLPHIDILINNVGVYSSKDFINTTEEDWKKMNEVNIMSGVRLSKSVLPKLLEKGWGRIIFISSECSHLVPSDLIAYSSTKASIEAISKGLAQLCKGTEVTVNSIMPGSTLTEGAEIFLKNEAKKSGLTPDEVAADFFKSTRNSSLIGRFLDPHEISSVVTFLSSPNSAAINGAVINATGGSVR